MTIAIVDCGTGNLLSVQKALAKLGAEGIITTDPQVIGEARAIILPGVGAWDPAISFLQKHGLTEVLKKEVDSGKPFLGVCLGAQLLHNASEEGKLPGLGWVHGKVVRFRPKDSSLKVPHMGWNSLRITRPSPVLAGIDDGAQTYFVHSFYFVPDDPTVVSSTTEYDVEFASSVWRENIFGAQFHPEKSGAIGMKVLENFLKLLS